MQAQYIRSRFANKNHDHYIQLQDYYPFELQKYIIPLNK